MPTNTAYAAPSELARVPSDGAAYIATYDLSFTATGTVQAAGDNVVVFTAPYPLRVYSGTVTVPATLGAATTLQMRRVISGAPTAISAATTPAAVGFVASNVAPFTMQAGDTIDLLIAGGPIATAGVVTVDLNCKRAV
jgi:hypothetical protein